MAEFVDDVVESKLKVSTIDEPLDDNPEEQAVQKEPEDDVPEKYRGKSAKEIIKMHQEAEKALGRQGSEVGELRKVVDDFIKTQTFHKSKNEAEVEEEVDFFADPDKAVKRAIEKHPSVIEAKEASIAMKREQTLNALAQKHGDFMQDVQDPAFADWIKSSKVRTELFARAEAQFDFDAADELLTTWNDRKKATKVVVDSSKQEREGQLKAADVGSQGASETASRKKYRRSDIIKLMQTDPDRYDAMSEEIMKAYSEGRVI